MSIAFPRIPFVVLLLLLILLSACSHEETGVRVSLRNVAKDEKHIPDRPEKGALKIAIAARVTPRESLDVYQEILEYVSEKLGRNVELVQRKTYAEVNDLLKRNLIDAAFVCTQAYVEGHREFGMELVAAPVVRGEALYRSYIIVHRYSTIKTFKNLRGMTFAFSDPMSNSGKLAPTFLLAQTGETPDSFFSRYVFTYAHSNSIRSVAEGLVDGAAVDSLVWDYANAVNPEYTSRTKIIYESQPFSTPPIVVHPEMDAQWKAKLREVFLGMHENEKGKAIINAARIDRFTTVSDGDYDSVREMIMYLSGRGG